MPEDLLSSTLPSALADGRVLRVLLGSLSVLVIAFFVLWRVSARRARRARERLDAVRPSDLDLGLAERVLELSDLVTGPSARAQVDRLLLYLRIEPLHVEVGDAFDDVIHASVGTEPTAAALGGHAVAAVVRPGWRHDGRVIRPADVTVTVPRP